MTGPSKPYISIFQRAVRRLAGFYLLFMLFYLAARFIIQDHFWVISLLNSFALLLFIPLPVLLSLALLARSRNALLSLLPIIFLAVFWFGPRFMPKATAASGAPALRVMTNNIWHWNQTPEAVAKLVQNAQPDVVFLQEVDLSTQQQALAALDAIYPYRASQVDAVRQSEQAYPAVNLTYSRYPFVEAEASDLPDRPFVDRNVVEVNGQRIALYNVHLIAPVDRRPLDFIGGLRNNYFVRIVLGFDDTERNEQVAALMAQLANEPYPYLAAGDFNTSDTSMTYSRMASQMKDSFAEAGVGLGLSWPKAEALGWPRLMPLLVRMDYIWHSAGLHITNVWQGKYVGSDHLPLLADFTLAPD